MCKMGFPRCFQESQLSLLKLVFKAWQSLPLTFISLEGRGSPLQTSPTLVHWKHQMENAIHLKT